MKSPGRGYRGCTWLTNRIYTVSLVWERARGVNRHRRKDKLGQREQEGLRIARSRPDWKHWHRVHKHQSTLFPEPRLEPKIPESLYSYLATNSHEIH